MYKYFVILTITGALALPNPDEANKVEKVNIIKKDCVNGILSPSCLKLGAITLLEKLNNKEEVALIPGVSIVKEGGKSNYEAVATDLARSLSSDPEDKLDKSLLYHVGSFLDNHSVKLRLLDDSAVEEAKTAIEEGRKMKGKKGGMGGLIAMAAMMKADSEAILGHHNESIVARSKASVTSWDSRVSQLGVFQVSSLLILVYSSYVYVGPYCQ